jgi:hypothetical protein
LINEIQSAAVPEKKPIWGGWATFGLGIAILAVYLFAQTITAAVFIIGKIVSDSENIDVQAIYDMASNGDVISWVTIISGILGTGLTLIFIKIRKGAGIREYLGFKAFPKIYFLILSAIIIGLVVLSFVLDQFVPSPQDTVFLVDTYKTSTWPVFLWIAVVGFAPLFEEIFFRGFVFVGFQQSRLGAAGTIAVTSVVWAILHMQYTVYGIISILVLGVVFGLVRVKTNSLWSTLFLHAAWNALAMLSTVLYINGVLQ